MKTLMRTIFLLYLFFIHFNLFSQVNLTLKTGAQLRASNNPHSQVISSITKGTRLSVLSLDDQGYYKVTYNGRVGYINKMYFDSEGENPNFKSSNKSSISNNKNLWNENQLKSNWIKNGLDFYEGIYEQIVSSYEKNRGISSIKLGLKKASSGYDLIYLSGAPQNYSQYWKAGDLKAVVTPTAIPSFYKLKWFDSEKKVRDAYLKLEEGTAELTFDNGEKLIFLKMFPSSEDIPVISKKIERSSSGTGFAISTNGLIVTNYHVIEGASNILVTNSLEFSKRYKAEILLTDKINDLAILRVSDVSFKELSSIPYVIRTSLSDVGERVFALGFPLISSMGLEVKLTDGVISSKTGFKGDVTTYQISAPVQPGNSGGPLFDSKGNLIGVINAKHKFAENASYAIKASYLKNLIDLLPYDLKLQTNSVLGGKSLSQQVNIIKEFVFIIESY